MLPSQPTVMSAAGTDHRFTSVAHVVRSRPCPRDPFPSRLLYRVHVGQLVYKLKMGFVLFQSSISAALLLVFISTFLVKEINGQCSSHQFKCDSSKCIPLLWQCDGENDCEGGNDELNCEARVCTETEFQCSDGRCIPSRWQCDNENDCADGSDEKQEVCHNRTCEMNEFACHSQPGVCVPITWHCDGTEDCDDGSDEKIDCEQITCTEDEFTCNNNKCITKRWICDQDNDCGDKSDEFKCPNVTCSSTEYMCSNGKCIPETWHCDGAADCTDDSDEANCPSSGVLSSLCNVREFMCANKKDCIHIKWQCDGDADCPDRSDEVNCTNTCRPDQFQCKNLQCIPGLLQCNGMAECPDGSDEDDCQKLHPPKCDPLNQFDCGNNHCIPLSLVCNSKNDCGGFEDEPQEQCFKNECDVNNGGCSQLCQDYPLGFKCECHPGYALADNQTCKDVNECEIPGSCSQLCYNTKGGYKCECLEGYRLEPNNNRRCRSIEGHPALIFANRQDIRKIDLETLEYVSLVNDQRSVVAVDYDFRTGTIFWSDVVEEVIKSAPIDTGSPVTTVVAEKIVTVDGIAVDWVYEHIYWTDTGKNTIEMADRTGKMRKTLFDTELDEPRAIALNPLDGWMFWTDWGGPAKIERAGMDGSHRTVIISSDVKWPNGLSIDFVSKKIFWADAKLHILSSADFNGDNQRVILSSPVTLKLPFSIDVFEDWVYWSDWETEAIHRINKFTGQEMKDIAVGIYSPMDIHVYHHYKQPDGTNYCNSMNGRCSHLCLPSPNITSRSSRYTCACPDGMVLTDDSTTCVSEMKTDTVGSTSAVNVEKSQVTKAPVSKAHTSVQSGDANMMGIENRSSIHLGMSKAWESGQLAGIIIGGLLGLLMVVIAVSLLVYNHYKRKNVTSMNFDNPVYRKTTEDQFSLEKNQYHPARTYPPSLEPLTSPGTNEFV